jgi:lysophospholipase L1-like esterase
VAIVLLSLTGLDVLVTGVARNTTLADPPVDIQHPTTLLAKLDRLRAAPGAKVVLLGDSLIHGGILAEFGDADWRTNGLDHQLADEVERRTGVRPLVMNLGMNGALPADLEVLAELVAACGVDWVILDVHLRPFSADFSPPDRRMSRPWLREMRVDSAGRVRWRPDGPGGWVSGRLCDVSGIAGSRGLVRENLRSSIAARQPVLRPSAPQTDTDGEVQALVKLAQLKARLRTLDLGPEAPQAAAFRRLLAGLAERGQRHIVFYAKENPALRDDVVDPGQYANWYAAVVGTVQAGQGPGGRFVPPMGELQPEHFLDFTHVNAQGYRIMARRLAGELE